MCVNKGRGEFKRKERKGEGTDEESETQKGQKFFNLSVLCKKISLSSHSIVLILICQSIFHQGLEELQFNLFQYTVKHLLAKVPT